MMTVLAVILSVVFVAAGCFILLRDLYNIVDAISSGIQTGTKVSERKAGNVQLKKAYAAR